MTHTFFINASSGTFERYRNLLEMEVEKRTLLTPDMIDDGKPSYPIGAWLDFDGEKRNYEHCADKIVEIINSDKNVGDHFNLLIYINLNEFEEYLCIAEQNVNEKVHCREALRRILRSFVYHTMYDTLEKHCCAPMETLLILDTGYEPFDIEVESERIHEMQCRLLGMDEAFFENYGKMGASEKNFEEMFLREKQKRSFWQGVREFYIDSLKRLFCSYAPELSDPLLVGELLKPERSDCAKKVKTVLFEENRWAGGRTAGTKIALYVYLLKCINAGTILRSPDHNKGDGGVIAIPKVNTGALKTVLKQKRSLYEREYKRFYLDGSCEEMKADFQSKIENISYSRYGLNQYGTRACQPPKPILEISKVSSEMKKYMEEHIQQDEETDEYEKPSKKKKIKGPKVGSDAELIAKADDIKSNHENFPNFLKTNVNVLLSDYAQGSPLNEARLPKRKPNEKHYLLTEEKKPSETEETERKSAMQEEDPEIEDVRTFSREAYRTAKEEYLKENRVPCISETIINDQYEWVKKRAREIAESIRNIRRAAALVCALLCCAYLPFFIIQWNRISENLFTLGGALITAAIPFVILIGVMGYLIGKQQEEYTKAYLIFLGNVEKSVRTNKTAWNGYISLLEKEIPSLRYLYEYKSDVDCAFQYYRVELGKCQHHRNMLARRKETIANILEDLNDVPEATGEFYDYAAGSDKEDKNALRVDYKQAYSCGRNAEIYSILTQKDIEAITEETKGGSVWSF